MESHSCIYCGEELLIINNFCPKCGNELKCKSCGTLINKGDNYCSSCGKPTINLNNAPIQQIALNTIKYQKKQDEVSYEFSFTDTIGKEGINELVSAVTNTKNNYYNLQSNPAALQSRLTIPVGINHDAYKIDTNDGNASQTNTSNEKLETTENIEIPHINDIENKLECSESVWIAIHAYYKSNFGSINFNKEEVRNAYMSRRKTSTRSKNFASEWKKAHQRFFKTINDNELSFRPDGIEYIKGVILGTPKVISKKNKSAKDPKGTKKTSPKAVPIEEFDFSKSADPLKPSLEEFMATKMPLDNTYDRIVVIAYYITRINKGETFSEGQIEFAYKALQLDERPGHLRQTINNIKNSKVWFKDVSQGKWSLERTGEIYVDEKLPIKKKS